MNILRKLTLLLLSLSLLAACHTDDEENIGRMKTLS